MQWLTCESCARHVRLDARVCPFCRAAVTRPRRASALSMLAVAASTAACYGMPSSYYFNQARTVDAQDIYAAEFVEQYGSIGVAMLREDGALQLVLHQRERDGVVRDSEWRIAATHPRYAALREHIGPMRVGESLAVRPFRR